MFRLLLGRLGSFIVTLLAASIIVFVVLDILPGDPAAILLGTSARPDTLAALRHQLGIDRPLILQYLEWKIDPTIAAVSVLQILFIGGAMLLTDRFVKIGRVV